MKRKLLGLGAACAVALLLWGTFDTAEARRGGGGGWRGGGGHAHFRAFSGGHFRGGGFRHGHRRAFIALPFAAYGGYSYYNGGGCYWLKQRAVYTGSRYWWRRYQDCISGYGY